MPYVQGTAIDKIFKGSFEHKALTVKEFLEKHVGKEINVLSVHQDYSVFADQSGAFHEATYKFDGEKLENIEIKPTNKIPVIQDADVPVFVSESLRAIASDMSAGNDPLRTQVREVMQLLRNDEEYWIGDIITKLEESANDSEWYRMYDANKEQIRTSMYGSIREIEARVPKTRYVKIPKSKLPEFEKELRESVSVIRAILEKVVDETQKMVFSKEDGFYGAIQKSLTVEAQALQGLLGKAEKLMRKEDVFRIAMAHDRLAERSRIMSIVTEHLKGRAQKGESA